jgi:hypothetical protein
MKKYFTIFALGMMALSTAAFAGTVATGTNTVAPTLQISATVQSAVQLTLSTGTSTAAHCAVSAPGPGTDYAMTFGTVDALALSTPTCGSKFAPTNPGSSPAVYWSDYNLTPVWTSQATNAATVTARVTTDFPSATRSLTVVRDSANSTTVPTGVGSFTPISTATADTIATATAVTNGTPQTRFIGVQVAPTSGAGIPATAQTATVTFTLTIN